LSEVAADKPKLAGLPEGTAALLVVSMVALPVSMPLFAGVVPDRSLTTPPVALFIGQ
jgi:hypothetical protein